MPQPAGRPPAAAHRWTAPCPARARGASSAGRPQRLPTHSPHSRAQLCARAPGRSPWAAATATRSRWRQQCAVRARGQVPGRAATTRLPVSRPPRVCVRARGRTLPLAALAAATHSRLPAPCRAALRCRFTSNLVAAVAAAPSWRGAPCLRLRR